MIPLIKDLLLLLVVLSAVPIGLFIAKYTKEEIKKGKFWFIALMIASAIIFLISFIIDFPDKLLARVSSGFIFILASVSLLKAKK